MDYNFLVLDDPMYYDYDGKLAGWFYGDENRNYREYAAKIVEKFSDHFKIAKKDVVFFGSSSGGVGAIHTAAIFGEGTAVSINGQIYPQRDYIWEPIFTNTTKLDIHKPDKYGRNDLPNVMLKAVNTDFILIENCYSPKDWNVHLKGLCEELGFKPLNGISQFGNIIFWIYNVPQGICCEPHSAFENRPLFYSIDYLTKLVKNKEDLEKYKPLYLMFNEFWRAAYSSKIKVRISNTESMMLEDLVEQFKKKRDNCIEQQKVIKELENQVYVKISNDETLTIQALISKLVWNRANAINLNNKIKDLEKQIENMKNN